MKKNNIRRIIKFKIWDNEENRMIIENGNSLHCYDNWCIDAFDGKVVDYVGSIGDHEEYIKDDDKGYYINKNGKKTKLNPLGWKRVNKNRYVPLQFTGLNDSQKNEIYEGDILLLNCGKIYESHYEVVFDNAKFYLISAKRDGDEYGVYTRELVGALHSDNPIVVGNIYENKELLK